MIIYLAVNRRTGLKYVGATKLASFARRQTEHRSKASRGRKTRFHSAIRECGWDAFSWHVLSECTSMDELLAEERRWVAAFDTQNPALGYNMTRGGCGVIGYEFSEAARAKISKAGMGRVHSEETCRKKSIANKGNKPSEATLDARRKRKMTEEEKRRIGDVNRNRAHVWSDDQRQKYYEGQKRRKENDKNSKVPHSHLGIVRGRRASGETLAAIGETYGVKASTLLTWLQRRAS